MKCLEVTVGKKIINNHNDHNDHKLGMMTSLSARYIVVIMCAFVAVSCTGAVKSREGVNGLRMNHGVN